MNQLAREENSFNNGKVDGTWLMEYANSLSSKEYEELLTHAISETKGRYSKDEIIELFDSANVNYSGEDILRMCVNAAWSSEVSKVENVIVAIETLVDGVLEGNSISDEDIVFAQGLQPKVLVAKKRML